MQYLVINMAPSIIYREKYGAAGHYSVYVRNPRGDGTMVQLGEGLSSPPSRTFYSMLVGFLVEVFLPQGYPESVREDYASYQTWDTVQAFCSTISGILTTHAIMKSVGVGDAGATALSATLTWVLKDGIGMIGRILFAWWRGHALDTDCKKWRLFADYVNDAAMALDLLLLPLYPLHCTLVLCLTTSMKGIVGVAGGASRAAITQHHAIRGNNGDVSAKDGSQETCVNLLASSVGVALLTYTQDRMMIWLLFSVVTFLHLFANYKAVKSLGLVTFNAERLNRYLRRSLVTDTSYSPRQVNAWESVLVGRTYTDRQLCGLSIRLGCSGRVTVRSSELLVLTDLFRHRSYLLLPDLPGHRVSVLLSSDATTLDVLRAYLHCVLLGLAVSCTDHTSLSIFAESPRSRVINRIEQGLRKLNALSPSEGKCPLEALSVTDDIIDAEFHKFCDGLKLQGWSTDYHSLLVDEWRGEWQNTDFSESSKNK